MSPLQIQIMLHYYVRTDDWDCLNDFHWRLVGEFVETGLLELAPSQDGKKYRITERGIVYVDALKNMPLPVKKWVMP